ncbi:MAG: ATP-binding protein [Gemmatimonadaceae bacterium]
MFLWWGPDLIQFYNDAYRPSFADGGRHPRALGARGREFWTDIWHIIGSQIEQVMAGGESTWHEDQLVPILRNGRLEDVWWTYGYSPAFDDDSRVAGVLVVCQETTGRVEADARLRAVNEQIEMDRSRLMAAFKDAPSFVAILRGPPFVFEFVNGAYYDLVGVRDLVGRPVFEVIPEARNQGFEVLLDDVVRTGIPFIGREVPIALARGSQSEAEVRIIDFVYFPLVETDGGRSGVIAHGVDVTDHVRARKDVERLLAESEEARKAAEGARERTAALQALTGALSSAAGTAEIEEAIVTHTAAAFGAVGVVVAGISEDGEFLELLGARHMPADIREAWRRFPIGASAPLADAVRSGEAMFLESRLDWATQYPDMEPLLEATGHHANIVAPLVVNQRVLGVLGAAFDAPRAFSAEDRAEAVAIAHQCAQALERARLFESERVARHAAEAANRAKGEFLAVMSHELRTPLNAIGGYAELIELGIRGPVTELQRDDLARIQKSQRHLLGLINGVLNYSRVEAGAVRYAMRDVKVDEVLATCEALVAPQMSARRLTLTYDRCDSSAAVRADSEKLQQIVLNLLTNALKFTDQGGRIDLWCVCLRDEVRIRVRDSGRGIAADQLERVFEPFVQVDAGFTRTQEGVGLGLAISRDLARGMGGELVAESVVGEGSTFTLTLPAA